jgi:hypothetical protein
MCPTHAARCWRQYVQHFHGLVKLVGINLNHFHGFQLFQTGLLRNFIFPVVGIGNQMTNIGNVAP